jgi:hypothetical protein
MTQQTTAQEVYKQRVDEQSVILKKIKSKRSRLGWVRLVMVLGIILEIYSLFINNSVVTWVLVFAGIVGFLYVLSIDSDNNSAIAFTKKLLAVNLEELSILEGNYYQRENGSNYLPKEHPYAGDIDLFGLASLYQYINRCTSQEAKRFFADLLLNPSKKEEILQRQEAARALSAEIDWRQNFQVSGMMFPLTFETEEKIKSWIELPPVLTTRFWQTLPTIFTIITFASLAAYLFDLIPTPVFSLLIFVYFLFANYTSGKASATHKALSKIETEVNTIEEQLKQVESIPASAMLLNSYKEILIQTKGGSVSTQELKQILKRFDFRLNVFVFAVINTFLLWDVRQMNSLNKWREKYATAVAGWFEILTNIEVINTLATLTYNHPDWVFPVIADDHYTLYGEEIGHPLIDTKKRVTNSFNTNGIGKVNVITGSNMAGKSTFLRSVGVNIVLAQIGAPVCAKNFTCSLVHLYSSMRIADNLAENTSTFYAELKKLKSIIDQVKEHQKVFILLDEILRGTNSLDRHTGSEALIKQLIREDAVAIIATHDVELATLENNFSAAISNYHFDVQVAGEELYFDYKLKRGVCQSMNASLLMKKIGIEM